MKIFILKIIILRFLSQHPTLGERRMESPDLRLEIDFTSPLKEVKSPFSPASLPRPGGIIEELWSSREVRKRKNIKWCASEAFQYSFLFLFRMCRFLPLIVLQLNRLKGCLLDCHRGLPFGLLRQCIPHKSLPHWQVER